QLFSGHINIIRNIVTLATVTSGGSGYTAAPGVTFSGGGATVQATGTAIIDPATGKVVAIVMVSGGSGYSSTPTITFNNTGTGGSGAAAAAFVSATITRASGSELGSFVSDGFLPSQNIRIEGAGGANGDFQIAADPSSVSDSAIILATIPPAP